MINRKIEKIEKFLISERCFKKGICWMLYRNGGNENEIFFPN